MPKQKSEARHKAFEIYKNHNGKIKLRDLANQLELPEKTISGWKAKDKWDSQLIGVLQKDTEYSNKKTSVEKKLIKSVEENEELTEKQKLFCLCYVKNFNATQAAINAGYTENYPSETGYQLLQKATVQKEIKRLKEMKKAALLLNEDDIVERYMKIAFADMTDFVEFGTEEISVIDKETDELVTRIINRISFKDSSQVDGGLICEVSQGKDGAKLKLEDRQKALDWLAKYFLMNPLDKHKIDYDNKKLEMQHKNMADDEPIEIHIVSRKGDSN